MVGAHAIVDADNQFSALDVACRIDIRCTVLFCSRVPLRTGRRRACWTSRCAELIIATNVERVSSAADHLD